MLSAAFIWTQEGLQRWRRGATGGCEIRHWNSNTFSGKHVTVVYIFVQGEGLNGIKKETTRVVRMSLEHTFGPLCHLKCHN